MNPRINELAVQANKEFGLTFSPEQVAGSHEFLQKFAELIIKECTSVLETKVDEGEGYGSYENGVHQGLIRARLIIKNHFGFEE